MTVPWGEKALAGYLGEDKEAWKEYDATELLKGFSGTFVPTLIDIGTNDNFMYQLSPHTFAAVAMEKSIPITMRMQVRGLGSFTVPPQSLLYSFTLRAVCSCHSPSRNHPLCLETASYPPGSPFVPFTYPSILSLLIPRPCLACSLHQQQRQNIFIVTPWHT